MEVSLYDKRTAIAEFPTATLALRAGNDLLEASNAMVMIAASTGSWSIGGRWSIS